MKKFLFSSALLACLCANAEYMMWTVDTDLETFDSGIDVNAIETLKVYSQKSGESAKAMTIYNMKGESLGDTEVYFEDGAGFKVDLTGMTTGSYSFYIELLNSSGQAIGTSYSGTRGNHMTYTDLQNGNYVATGDIGVVPQTAVWHGGGSFEAVPEPSSMALFALGAGLVGLRRKLRKNKKGKRA